MTQNEFMGMLIGAVIALGGLSTLLYKAIKPMHSLEIAITKLTSTINRLLENDQQQDREIEALKKGHTDHEVRIKIIEETNYIKDRS